MKNDFEVRMGPDSIRLAGTVKALEEGPLVQIVVEGADEQFDALRIPNVHNWQEGKRIEMMIRAT